MSILHHQSVIPALAPPAAPSAADIGLVAHTATDTGLAAGVALITLQMLNSGLVAFVAQNALTLVPALVPGEWLITGLPANWDVRATLTAGTAPGAGNLNVWENLGTTRVWNNVRGVTPGTTTSTLTLDFSLAGLATAIKSVPNIVINATLP